MASDRPASRAECGALDPDRSAFVLEDPGDRLDRPPCPDHPGARFVERHPEVVVPNPRPPVRHLVRAQHLVGGAERVPVPARLREVAIGRLAQNQVTGPEEEPRQQPVASFFVPRRPALGRPPGPAGPLRPVRPVAVGRADAAGLAAGGSAASSPRHRHRPPSRGRPDAAGRAPSTCRTFRRRRPPRRATAGLARRASVGRRHGPGAAGRLRRARPRSPRPSPAGSGAGPTALPDRGGRGVVRGRLLNASSSRVARTERPPAVAGDRSTPAARATGARSRGWTSTVRADPGTGSARPETPEISGTPAGLRAGCSRRCTPRRSRADSRSHA